MANIQTKIPAKVKNLYHEHTYVAFSYDLRAKYIYTT